MRIELSPEGVFSRLENLRRLYVAETIEEGRVRMRHVQARELTLNPAAVEQRLAELRALSELTRHLQSAK